MSCLIGCSGAGRPSSGFLGIEKRMLGFTFCFQTQEAFIDFEAVLFAVPISESTSASYEEHVVPLRSAAKEAVPLS